MRDIKDPILTLTSLQRNMYTVLYSPIETSHSLVSSIIHMWAENCIETESQNFLDKDTFASNCVKTPYDHLSPQNKHTQLHLFVWFKHSLFPTKMD